MERCSQSPEGIDFLAAHLAPEQFRHLVNYQWAVAARDDQLAPILAKGGGRWHTWLILGGRGSGKTRAGAEWVRAQAIGEPPLADRRSHRIALVGDTIAQVRSIMIEGVSGLMSIYPPKERPKLEVSKNRLIWENGTMAQLFGADDPDCLRGPQFDAACGLCPGVAVLRGFLTGCWGAWERFGKDWPFGQSSFCSPRSS